ncbi:ribosome biogenesis GTP-binding protein YihA/YsxC [Leeuwenhoekiella sp. NPDC079379]|uniref:ribosome biogenesis GTP-binding protein YihA/YsxC n=1 Tax=Leeuwenhoekiella sp. NPDC079379 TaxID=3364122 RepID=UPI0037C7BB96
MRIKSAEFLVSNSNVAKCPQNKMPEYAFIGRSNVGKSSLINMLTDRKNLAKTSGRPGKTQLINHFVINETWYLVDLPGYGYARVSKKAKKEFQKFITQYFEEREQLVSAFVLIDCRHDPQPIDKEFMEYMGEKQIPFSIIFTKADKLKPKALERNIENYKQALLEGAWLEMPNYFISSASNSEGKEEILEYIGSINEQLKDQ